MKTASTWSATSTAAATPKRVWGTRRIGDAAAESYSRIRFDLERRGKPVGPNDLIVAATVMADRGTLVTYNLREFRRIKDLLVEDWTK